MPTPKTNKKNSSKQLNRNKAKKATRNPMPAKKPLSKTKKGQIKHIRPPKPAKSIKLSKAAQKRNEETQRQEAALIEMRKTGELLSNQAFLHQVNSNVGKEANDILKSLVKSPKTDEDIASQLSMKVNDVRRMLNVMNSFSIVRYDVNKDSKGWLIFKWRIDGEKLGEYITGIEQAALNNEPSLPVNVNDFFVCKKCYVDNKVVHPFDSAFEVGFTCDGCGKPFAIMNREQAVALFKETISTPSA